MGDVQLLVVFVVIYLLVSLVAACTYFACRCCHALRWPPLVYGSRKKPVAAASSQDSGQRLSSKKLQKPRHRKRGATDEDKEKISQTSSEDDFDDEISIGIDFPDHQEEARVDVHATTSQGHQPRHSPPDQRLPTPQAQVSQEPRSYQSTPKQPHASREEAV